MKKIKFTERLDYEASYSFTMQEMDWIAKYSGIPVEELKKYDGVAEVHGMWKETPIAEVPLAGACDNSAYYGRIEIPSTVTHDNKTYLVTGIYLRAFYNSFRVTSVIMPDSIIDIESSVFMGSHLSEVVLSKNLRNIGFGVFFCCEHLMKVTLPDSLSADLLRGDAPIPKIQKGAVKFHDKYENVGLFQGCINLNEVTIGKNIGKMEGTFWLCNALKTVICKATTPPVITEDTFTEKAYQNATLYVPFLSYEAYKKDSMWGKFRKIEPIPETIPATGQFYFMVDGIRYKTKGDNSNEVYVAPLENGVYDEKKMGSNMSGVYVAPDASQAGHRPASPRAPKPAGIEIPSQVQFADKTYVVTGICDSAFEDSKVSKVELPNTIKYIGNSAFRCAQISSMVIPNSVQLIEDEAFLGCNKLTEIEIPGSIATIGNDTFEDCNNIKRITLHNGLKKIGACAFNGLDLEQLTIPETVVEIGESAFSSSGAKLSITIPDKVVTIGSYAFNSCSLRSLTLGKGLTRIENNVFCGNELKELVIPAGITSIGKKAFAENDNNFQTITCKSTTPPKIEADTFDELTFKNATLEVTWLALDAYKKDPVWGKFSQITKYNTHIKPENAKMIPEPIRYISLRNEGDFNVRMHIQCDELVYNTRLIAPGQERTIDVTEKPLKNANEIWLGVEIDEGTSNNAQQIFVSDASSNKKACYTIKGTAQDNSLSYDGIKESE